jgi:hypothetical protein
MNNKEYELLDFSDGNDSIHIICDEGIENNCFELKFVDKKIDLSINDTIFIYEYFRYKSQSMNGSEIPKVYIHINQKYGILRIVVIPQSPFVVTADFIKCTIDIKKFN